MFFGLFKSKEEKEKEKEEKRISDEKWKKHVKNEIGGGNKNDEDEKEEWVKHFERQKKIDEKKEKERKADIERYRLIAIEKTKKINARSEEGKDKTLNDFGLERTRKKTRAEYIEIYKDQNKENNTVAKKPKPKPIQKEEYQRSKHDKRRKVEKEKTIEESNRKVVENVEEKNTPIVSLILNAVEEQRAADKEGTGEAPVVDLINDHFSQFTKESNLVFSVYKDNLTDFIRSYHTDLLGSYHWGDGTSTNVTDVPFYDCAELVWGLNAGRYINGSFVFIIGSMHKLEDTKLINYGEILTRKQVNEIGYFS